MHRALRNAEPGCCHWVAKTPRLTPPRTRIGCLDTLGEQPAATLVVGEHCATRCRPGASQHDSSAGTAAGSEASISRAIAPSRQVSKMLRTGSSARGKHSSMPARQRGTTGAQAPLHGKFQADGACMRGAAGRASSLQGSATGSRLRAHMRTKTSACACEACRSAAPCAMRA
jgi:hypothetical protein